MRLYYGLSNGQNTKKNVFAEIKLEDMKCPRVLFHKQKHDYEFVSSSLKSFKGSPCSFDKIITLQINRRFSLKYFKGS